MRFTEELLNIYRNIMILRILYLNSVLNSVSKLDLTSAVSYEDALEAIESLGLKNMDQVFPQFVQSNDTTLSVDLRWVQLFKVTSTFTELPKIIGKNFSIPISNICGQTSVTACQWTW